MTLRDMFVHVDTSSSCEARLEVAVSLARRHGARLTGLAVLTHGYYEPRSSVADQWMADATGLFGRVTVGAEIETRWRSIDWSVVGTGVPEILIRQGYCTDLVVVGQAGEGNRVPADLPQRLVLAAGRPILVVPYAGAFPTVGERVLVAWRAGRESARAVGDALPILRAAREVTLLMIASPETPDDGGGADIREYLARHGVNIEVEQASATGIPVGDMLLNRVSEGGHDLLVMGAYTRLTRGVSVLGPVAVQILREMTVPVLMAH
ncbi:universal stress protein [Geobacter sp.]|uniref:universal stress protein n=1 Tax=Geobacter sp. TaxID=46610 RepID=UPI00261D4CDC|nr:universal stress protein [Geobacter sp.]